MPDSSLTQSPPANTICNAYTVVNDLWVTSLDVACKLYQARWQQPPCYVFLPNAAPQDLKFPGVVLLRHESIPAKCIYIQVPEGVPLP